MAASGLLQVAVSPFLGVLFDKLSSLLQKEVGLIWGVEKEMNKLANTLSIIRDVLEDAEEKQMISKAVANWLSKLRSLVHDADDILDEWATEAMYLESEARQITCAKQVRDSFLTCFRFKQVMFRRKMAKRVNDLRENFDEIASERVRFGLREGISVSRREYYPSRETSSVLADPQVYGRDEDKECIVALLLSNADTQDLSICSIVGIGGLGKTTVAQLCYNDERIKEHFDVRIWVCVSDDFDIKVLTRAIIVSSSRDTCPIEELDPLQSCLQESLAGRRFLLVLDDVWNENQEEWNRFKNSLQTGAKGSSIVVTTRLKTVASITSTCCPYFLKSLSQDDCWLMFRQRAFGMGNEEYPNLVKIGEEIVKKCGGVPLAAKVMGGLMRFKKEEKEWLYVRDSRIWDLPQSEENILLPALRLSYTNLSPYLRQCFAYSSIFPKGHRMDKEELIRLWTANGLIQSKDEIQTEVLGNEVFNALSWRSLFQDERENSDGVVMSCTMHDLVHDLASSVNVNECSHLGEGEQITNVPKGTRHLAVSMKTYPSAIVGSILQSAANLRTLIVLSDPWGNDFLTKEKLLSFKSLRALSLESGGLREVPDTIGNLKHLRYLNFSRTRVAFLPASICELINLQRLELEDCYCLNVLPECMRNMSNLRHLNIKGCNRLSQMPSGMGKLIHLQTLSFFIVGTDNSRLIDELQGLNCLAGNLEIKGLEHVKTLEDAKEGRLLRKQNLFSLNLLWSDSDTEFENQRNVIEGLQPHPNIKELSIKGYSGLTSPSWLNASSLPSLETFEVFSCQGLQSLPELGRSLTVLSIKSCLNLTDLSQLLKNQRNLQCLTIEGCPKVDISRVEYQHLVSLRTLIIRGIPDLTSLPDGMHHVSATVRRLWIENCVSLISLPDWIGSLANLTYLRLLDCKNLRSLPDGMQNLTNLSVLSVGNCHPELHERCKRNGEDWPKIARVEHPRIFQTSGKTNNFLLQNLSTVKFCYCIVLYLFYSLYYFCIF
ncbi:hypothetical protein ACHQM5_029315 [Ranunculus cassubicifolius]